jgi:hypothetical protein
VPEWNLPRIVIDKMSQSPRSTIFSNAVICSSIV